MKELTKDNMLLFLLRNGWNVNNCHEGEALLSKGDFKWQINIFNFTIDTLLDAMVNEALYRGRLEK